MTHLLARVYRTIEFSYTFCRAKDLNVMSVLLNVLPCVYRNMTTRKMALRRIEEWRMNKENTSQVE